MPTWHTIYTEMHVCHTVRVSNEWRRRKLTLTLPLHLDCLSISRRSYARYTRAEASHPIILQRPFQKEFLTTLSSKLEASSFLSSADRRFPRMLTLRYGDIRGAQILQMKHLSTCLACALDPSPKARTQVDDNKMCSVKLLRKVPSK